MSKFWQNTRLGVVQHLLDPNRTNILNLMDELMEIRLQEQRNENKKISY